MRTALPGPARERYQARTMARTATQNGSLSVWILPEAGRQYRVMGYHVGVGTCSTVFNRFLETGVDSTTGFAVVNWESDNIPAEQSRQYFFWPGYPYQGLVKAGAYIGDLYYYPFPMDLVIDNTCTVYANLGDARIDDILEIHVFLSPTVG